MFRCLYCRVWFFARKEGMRVDVDKRIFCSVACLEKWHYAHPEASPIW